MLTATIFNADIFLTLSNNADNKLQTEHILITDVSQRNEDSLICWYRSSRIPIRFSWYHEFIEHSASDGWSEIPKITQTAQYYFGWSSNIKIIRPYHKLKLLRQPDTVAVEGVFTCDTRYEESTSVGIHYPSELIVSNRLVLKVNKDTPCVLLCDGVRAEGISLVACCF